MYAYYLEFSIGVESLGLLPLWPAVVEYTDSLEPEEIRNTKKQKTK